MEALVSTRESPLEPVKFLNGIDVAEHLKQRVLDLASNPLRVWKDVTTSADLKVKEATL